MWCSKVALTRSLNVCCFACILLGVIGLGFAGVGLRNKYGGQYALTSLKLLLSAELTSILAGVLGLIAICRVSMVWSRVASSAVVATLALLVTAITVSELHFQELSADMRVRLQVLVDHYGYYVQIDRGYEGDNILNDIQRSLECCGVDTPVDWNATNYGKIPLSCCPIQLASECVRIHNETALFDVAYRALSRTKGTLRAIYERGCFDAIMHLYRESRLVLIACSGTQSFFLFVTLLVTLAYSCVVEKLDL